MTVLRIATRASALALAQTRLVADALTCAHPGLDVWIVSVKTAGDRDTENPLWKLPGSGFFTSALEEALLENTADVAVHSFKDLPALSPANLHIPAVFERRFPQDAMVCAGNIDCLDRLPRGARVGTSSPRRIAQLRLLRPDAKPVDMRGNIETRLAKLDRGDCDAIILARAGLERLGLAGRIGFSFDPRLFLPAPAQGALAVQTRADDQKIIALAAGVDHLPTRLTVMAERNVLARLHPGCHAPIGVFAELDNSDIIIRAFVADSTGQTFIRKQVQGRKDKAAELAEQLADELIRSGAAGLIDKEQRQ